MAILHCRDKDLCACAQIVELDKDLQTLKEENRRLAVQKADLEAAQRSSPKGTASAQRIRELEDAHAATVAENARLQVCPFLDEQKHVCCMRLCELSYMAVHD